MDVYEVVKIDHLIPYERNARTHSDEQIDMIANSIKEFGFIAPVIIDENNMILVGHGRVQGAKRAGLTEVPCRRITHLTEGQKRAYILADNRLSDLSGWDFEIYARELDEIDINMDGFGFDFHEELDESALDGLFVDTPAKDGKNGALRCPNCGAKIEI